MPSERRLRILLAAIVFVLFFYAIGVETDIFSSPVFSVFWVVNNDTAHTIVSFLAVAGTVVLALGLAALTILFVRQSQKFSMRKSGIGRMRADEAMIVRVFRNNSGGGKASEQTVLQLTNLSMVQARAQRPTNQKTLLHQEKNLQTNEDKPACPKSKTPLNPSPTESDSKPNLETSGPNLNQPLSDEQKPNVVETETLWRRYFKTSTA